MIKKEIINGRVFLEQRTYFIYANEKDWKNGKHILVTSDESIFKLNKKEKNGIIQL